MDNIIFRCDDVSFNTNPQKLEWFYNFLKSRYPDCAFWSCVTLFAKRNTDGSVYPDAPFKDNPIEFFYNVDSVVSKPKAPGMIVSHGLLHVDHSELSEETQEMSILTSCNYLKTSIFVPPFNRWNAATERVCLNNNISLIKFEEGWKSLEYNNFDPKHKLWYFHPWSWTMGEFEMMIHGGEELSELRQDAKERTSVL